MKTAPAALRPDAELTRTIAAYIRAGAYPHVAAAAAGVEPGVFDDWMDKGTKRRAVEAYRQFAAAVQLATAQARLAAEMAVHQEDPRTWLTKGPGKDAPGKPGWSGVVKPLVAVDNSKTVNLLADPGSAALISLLLAALAPYPEARKAAVAALNGEAPRPAALPAPSPADVVIDVVADPKEKEA
jgi:hypothetical protein